MPNPVRTFLVTGAMGQLGTYVARTLLARGHRVVGLDLRTDATLAAVARLRDAARQSTARQSAARQSAAQRPGEFVPAFVDLLDADKVRALLAEHQPSGIVHLAAMVAPGCYRNPEFARRVNVDGTANLVAAARTVEPAPVFIEASSASVYGARNPHTCADLLTSQTPVNPIDCYGAQKVAAEKIIAESGLPHAVLRLGGIISPDGARSGSGDHLALIRATPGDNRLHAVDVRDAALAFANAVELGSAIDGKVLLIGGGPSYMSTMSQLQDDMMEAMGLGRLGDAMTLPGDPADDRGWGLTDWFDTTQAQELLKFQEHEWADTVAWIAGSVGRGRAVLRVVAPVLRPLIRGGMAAQRHLENRGTYANPWRLLVNKYGRGVLAPGVADTYGL